MGRSTCYTAHKPVVAACYTASVDKLCLSFDKLRKRRAEQALLSLDAAGTVYGPENIAGLLYLKLHVDAVVGVKHTVVYVAVGHLRYILTPETLCYSRICCHDRVEIMSSVHQVGVSEF